MSEKIDVKVEVKVPEVPQVLWTDDKCLPLCALTEDAIKDIAVAWAEELLKSWHDQNQNRDDAYAMADAEYLIAKKYALEDQTASEQITEDGQE